jgi:hypothetical protein
LAQPRRRSGRSACAAWPVAMNDIAKRLKLTQRSRGCAGNDTSDGGMLDSASIVIVVAPTHGTAAVIDGKVRYTPASRYTGLDTFILLYGTIWARSRNLNSIDQNTGFADGGGGADHRAAGLWCAAVGFARERQTGPDNFVSAGAIRAVNPKVRSNDVWGNPGHSGRLRSTVKKLGPQKRLLCRRKASTLKQERQNSSSVCLSRVGAGCHGGARINVSARSTR